MDVSRKCLSDLCTAALCYGMGRGVWVVLGRCMAAPSQGRCPQVGRAVPSLVECSPTMSQEAKQSRAGAENKGQMGAANHQMKSS